MNNLPTLHVVGESIPQAYWRAIKAVWEKGATMRTQYDRKNSAGEYIDPPSRDARVLIEVKDPFAQPRFPPISFCEIGVYLAEIMGAKDYRVVPMDVLCQQVFNLPPKDDADLARREKYKNFWPYTYHQRLTSHPEMSGVLINQLGLAIQTVVKTPYTRRAVCTTSVPNLDPHLPEDVPCLRELQLRCVEADSGELILNPTTTWRSRDLYKAWGDNVIALTFLLQTVAQQICLGINRRQKVTLGSYADFSMSLHIYGQDFSHVGGDSAQGLSGFFDAFPTEDDFMARSLDSDMAKEMLVLPQLRNLLDPTQIEQNELPQKSQDLIGYLINGIEQGAVSC